MNGITSSLVSINKIGLCFLPKHLRLFSNKSIRTSIWSWRGKQSNLQPYFKSYKLAILWWNMREKKSFCFFLGVPKNLKMHKGLTFFIRL